MQAKGEFALVTQNIETAQAKSGQPVKRGTMAHEHHMYMLLTEAAVQQRDAAALRQYTIQLEELAIRDGHKLYLAIAHRAWGVAHRLEGEHAKAERRLEQALELFNELDTRWQIGRTLFELGELAVVQADPVSAREHYERAMAEFEALKAMPDAERTRQALQFLN